MVTSKYLISLKRHIFFCVSIFILGCIDPALPEYNFIDGLVYINGLASTVEGASYVTISKSELTSVSSKNVFVEGASVSFVNSTTNEKIILSEGEEEYFPPTDFAVEVGETWQLLIVMPDGKEYLSFTETVINPVPISGIEANYNPELVYNESAERYVPGHTISIDFNDPPSENNYYYWNFRSYEKLHYCRTCENGVFRNGVCEPNPPGVFRKNYYDYICFSDCWRIRYSESIKIYDDKLSNGNTITNLPVADVLLYTNANIVVQVQQFSLSEQAYEYYKVLKDIIDNNGNFNAPPPAAFVGNIFNPDDENEYVLGRFTATSTSTYPVYIERENIEGDPIDRQHSVQFETCPEVCSDPCIIDGAECDCCICGGCTPEIEAPCEERRNRTGIEPEGWVE